MAVVRLTLGLILIVSGTIMGLYLSRRLTRRRDILISFSELMTRASIRIRYNAEDVCAIFSDNASHFIFTYDEPFSDQWKRFVRSFRDALTADDLRMLCSFTDGLGSADGEAQQKHIAMFSKLIEEHLKKAREDIEKKAKLCRVLPVSLSFVLALLMI